MLISEFPQNSDGWSQERVGLPTASCFKEIVTSTGAPSKSRMKYMYRLAGERVTGERHKGYYGPAMAKGHEMESKARQLYEIQNHVVVHEVGLCYPDERKLFGASPDGLVDPDGGVEFKNAEPHIQAERLHKGWTGMEHHRQVMGCLLVTGRAWWDLVSYCQYMRPVTIRFERDEAFLSKLEAEVMKFCFELDELVKQISEVAA